MGSLRYAINQANLDPIGNGSVVIEPGGSIGPIILGSGLPSVTRADVTLEDLNIDGKGTGATSGTGSSNSGAPPLSTANGLSIAGSGDAVNGLTVTGFGGQGILVTAGAVDISQSVISGNGTNGITLESSNNSVTGNIVGLNAAGNAADPNGDSGIVISNGADNTIGGTGAGQGNIVSGNSADGIAALGSGATGNLIEGNYVGTDATGTFAIGNGSPGVIMFVGASDNTIGPGNVISGNDSQGIQLSTSDNLIVGNLIGTDLTGTMPIANTQGGIQISTPGSGNTIGGISAGDGNIISGNDSIGIELVGPGTTLNMVEGNDIGTNTSGATGLGNTGGGVDFAATNSGGPSDNNIGGSSSAYGNTINGNGGAGIYVFGSAISGNLIAANTISDNMSNGVEIIASGAGGPTGNTIGGTSAGYANNITSNDGAGVLVLGSGISGNLVAGNTISDNTGDGVDIIASTSGGPTGNAIGGASAGYANIITGNGTGSNGGAGILVLGGAISGNLIAGNTISDNTGDGVEILAGSASNPGGPTGNFIGGSSSAFGNDITSNGGSGIVVFGSAISGNLIAANTISDNSGDGVDIYAGPSGGPTGNTVGGPSAGYANIITSNSGNGIYVIGSGASMNLVEGNFIGTDSGGDTGLGNSVSGVRIEGGANNNTISGNVIASNGYDGVTIDGDGVSGNMVEDNFIGTDSAGDTGLGNGDSGVAIFGGASSNTISDNTIANNGANGYGGVDITGANDNVLDGNTVSGSAYDGVDIFGGATGNTIGGIGNSGNTIVSNTWGGLDISGTGTSDNLVEGNYIGTDSSDDPSLGNGLVGVTIYGGATYNTIGLAPSIAVDGFHADSISAMGNTIVSNGAGGVDIENSGTDDNVVDGNYIGTDSNGDTGLGNVVNGVEILDGASSNTIGGTASNAGNTIAANTAAGVDITDTGTSHNMVEGNFIGTNSSGATNLGNSDQGVVVQNDATNNTIGGVANVIAGNKNDGIGLFGPGTSGVTIENNFIGTDSAGDSGLGNAFWGIYVDDVPNVVVGTAGAGNVVSGNNQGGVTFRGILSVTETIQGNLIGVAPGGTGALGNSYSGVLIGDWGVSGDYPSDVTIGGTTSGTGNVISANGEWGVWISGASVTGIVVEGNTIGTDANSDTGLGNAFSGVQIDSGATNNTIGGTTAGAGNLISGNRNDGVLISGTGTSGNVVDGNNVGLNSSQSAGLGNTYGGVSIINGATNNTVGGTVGDAANTIAGNGTAATASVTYSNLAIYDAGSSGNVVEGNYIGTNASSAAGLDFPNNFGVFIGYGASGNMIGGSTAAARNIISGNTSVGVEIADAGASGNTIQGNYVGTNVAGTGALGNQTTGLLIASDGTAGEPSTDNLVIDNVLSGNGESGLAIENASHNTIEDNLIGTDETGTAAVPNQWDGVHLELLQGSPPIGTGAADNTIDGNTIDFNKLYGVLIEYSGSTGNSVQGNSIGTVGGNVLGGVMLDLGANGNSIGGTTANVISGNDGAGVAISGPGTSNNLVAGNFIGTTSGGTGLGNSGDGVTITDGATGNTIGGITAAAANTIADNTGNGVSISTSGTTGNVIEGNFIGTNSAGATNIGNTGDGVEVFNSASGNTIGGTVHGAGNVIDDNSTGVVIGSSPTDTAIHDAILGNSIYANTSLGIDLGDDGVTLNDSKGHTGPNLFQDFPVITNAYTVGATTTITGTVSGPANSTLRVELFSNPAADPSGYGQGKVFLGYVTVTTGAGGGGSFTFSPSSAVAVGQYISATATDVNGDTSEFAKDAQVSATAPLNIGFQITGPVYNPIKKTYSETVKLTNNGSSTVSNFRFVLEGLTSGVTLTNGNGTTGDGSPYVVVAGPLAPGQSITVTLTFTKSSSSLYINYTPMFVANI